MKKLFLCVMLGSCLICSTYAVNAAVINYSGDEAGFISAIQGVGLDTTTIDLEDLSLWEVLTNQYAPLNVVFSTLPGHDILIDSDCYGPAPHSGDRAAEAFSDYTDPEIFSSLKVEFINSSYGVSLWVGDINTDKYVDVEVSDINDQLLTDGSFTVSRAGDWTNVAVFSALKDIGSIVITASDSGDSIGFDDVTVPIPIPGAIWLLGSGLISLAGLRKFRKEDTK